MSDTEPHFPDDDPQAESTAGTATALAEPPRPPTVPPGVNAAGEAPRPRPSRTGVVVAVVVVLIALALLGVVGYLIKSAMSPAVSSTSGQMSAFASAMQKAGVRAEFPVAPIELDGVRASGSHPFSATFTAEEIAALLNTFPYTSNGAGINIGVRDVSLKIPNVGSVQLSARVTANGATYSGSVTAPASYAQGHIITPGATKLSVQGIPGSAAQKAQVSDALATYFNAYLSAAPGLHVDAARIYANGFGVTGTAPDTISYP